MGYEATAPDKGCAVPLAPGPRTDPMPRLFAEFQALLERHEAALAACDRIEAALLTQMDYPRVLLRSREDGSQRYAADALTLAQEVPPGRRRHRLQRTLRRRQRFWDAAAHAAGLTVAQMHEAALDGAVLDTVDGLLATPAWTLDAVVLKLLVLLSTRDPSLKASATSPWRELRLILVDLRALVARSRPHP